MKKEKRKKKDVRRFLFLILSCVLLLTSSVFAQKLEDRDSLVTFDGTEIFAVQKDSSGTYTWRKMFLQDFVDALQDTFYNDTQFFVVIKDTIYNDATLFSNIKDTTRADVTLFSNIKDTTRADATFYLLVKDTVRNDATLFGLIRDSVRTNTLTISAVWTFSGNNIFSGANTFSGNNTFSGVNNFNDSLDINDDIVIAGTGRIVIIATHTPSYGGELSMSADANWLRWQSAAQNDSLLPKRWLRTSFDGSSDLNPNSIYWDNLDTNVQNIERSLPQSVTELSAGSQSVAVNNTFIVLDAVSGGTSTVTNFTGLSEGTRLTVLHDPDDTDVLVIAHGINIIFQNNTNITLAAGKTLEFRLYGSTWYCTSENDGASTAITYDSPEDMNISNWWRTDTLLYTQNYSMLYWVDLIASDTLKRRTADGELWQRTQMYVPSGFNLDYYDTTWGTKNGIVDYPALTSWHVTGAEYDLPGNVYLTDSLTADTATFYWVYNFGSDERGMNLQGAVSSNYPYIEPSAVSTNHRWWLRSYNAGTTVQYVDTISTGPLHIIAVRWIGNDSINVWIDGVYNTAIGMNTPGVSGIYSPKFRSFWDLVYDEFGAHFWEFGYWDGTWLTDAQLTGFYDGYLTTRYVSKVNTEIAGNALPTMISDSTGKGALTGQIVFFGDIQLDSATYSTATWNDANTTGQVKMDTMFQFTARPQPYNSDAPDLRIVLGDNTNNSYQFEFDSLLKRIYESSIPTLTMPGNHDNRDTNFVKFQAFYNASLVYNNGADTLDSYLTFTQIPDDTTQYYIRGVYIPDFDTNLVIVIESSINNPSEPTYWNEDSHDWDWLDSISTAYSTKNIIYCDHRALWYQKGGWQDQRKVRGILGEHLSEYGKTCIGMAGHDNDLKAVSDDYGNVLMQTGAIDKLGLNKPNLGSLLIYENKMFLRNYSLGIHYGSGNQEDVLVEYNFQNLQMFGNGAWIDRSE